VLRQNLPRLLTPIGILEKYITSKEHRAASTDGEGIFYITRVDIPEDISFFTCNLEVTGLAIFLGGSVIDAVEKPERNELSLKVGIDDRVTDLIIFKKRSKLSVRKARIAIIVDDLGIKNLDNEEGFMKLSFPMTFSILPFQRFTADVCKMAEKYGRECILHMPMEPYGFPENNPGKGALMENDSTRELKQKLRKALEDVPIAVGMNNHMGSKATESKKIMKAVMSVLKEKGLFFIDSHTTPETAGYSTAKQYGLSTADTKLFLDNILEESAIIMRLDQAADIAVKNGSVVVICHDNPETLKVLKKKMPLLERKGIQFVKVSTLVE